jgi:hypothetical protein
LNQIPHDGLASLLERKIRSEMQKQGIATSSFVFSIKHVEMSGIYWMPLYKTGNYTYQVGVRSIGDTFVKNGQVAGDLNFTVTGISSVVNLKDQLMESVAKAILKAAKE